MGLMSREWIEIVNTGVVPVGLMLIMFSIGLTLALRDFALVARRPLLVGAGFFAHLLVLPMLGLAAGFLFRLPPEMALGLFIVSLCPAGTTSNAMTFVGRGNVALAVVLTALTSLVTVFTIPIVLAWAVPWFLEGGGRTVPTLSVPGVILQLVRITVIPIVVGMLVNRFAPALAARLARWLRPTAFVILVIVIGFSLIVSFKMVVERLILATPAIFALNIAATGAGLLIGRLLGANARDSMTLGIETGVQNVTLAIFLTLTVLGSLPLAVTQNIYGVVMIVNAALLIRWWRSRIAAEGEAETA
jgi:BASS family bile acid:Na+ symporter